MSVPPEWLLASFARHLHFTFSLRSISDYFVADEMAYMPQALVPMLMLAKWGSEPRKTDCKSRVLDASLAAALAQAQNILRQKHWINGIGCGGYSR